MRAPLVLLACGLLLLLAAAPLGSASVPRGPTYVDARGCLLTATPAVGIEPVSAAQYAFNVTDPAYPWVVIDLTWTPEKLEASLPDGSSASLLTRMNARLLDAEGTVIAEAQGLRGSLHLRHAVETTGSYRVEIHLDQGPSVEYHLLVRGDGHEIVGT